MKYTACSREERDRDEAGNLSGFVPAERQTAEEALDMVNLAAESLGMAAHMADYSIVEVHCPNVGVVEVGILEGNHQVAVALGGLAVEVLASWEIQRSRDIVDLRHLLMHLMASHEETQAIYAQRLEGESSGEDVVHLLEMTEHEGVANHEGQEMIL